VVPTQQEQILHAGSAALRPRLQVMRVCPVWRTIAAREAAPAVPQYQGPTHPGRYQAGGAADVQRFPGTSENGRDQRCVTRQPPRRGRVDRDAAA
jgi:hypothetical protein